MTWYCDYLTQFGRSLSHPGHTHSTTSLTGSVTTPGGPSIPSSLHNMPGSQGGNLSSQSARWKAIQVLKYCDKNRLVFYSEMFFITNKFLKLTQSHLEPIWIPSSVKFAVIRLEYKLLHQLGQYKKDMPRKLSCKILKPINVLTQQGQWTVIRATTFPRFMEKLCNFIRTRLWITANVTDVEEPLLKNPFWQTQTKLTLSNKQNRNR